MPRYLWIVLLASFLVSLTAASLIGYFFALQSQSQMIGQFTALREVSDKISHLTDRLAQIEKDQAVLSTQMQMRAKQDQPAESVEQDASDSHDARLINPEDMPDQSLVKEEPKDRHSELLGLLKTEPVDAQWSVEAQTEINNALADNPVAVKNAGVPQCRTHFCLLEISYNDPDQADVFVEKLSEKLNWPNSSMEIYYKNSKKDTDIFLFRSESR